MPTFSAKQAEMKTKNFLLQEQDIPTAVWHNIVTDMATTEPIRADLG